MSKPQGLLKKSSCLLRKITLPPKISLLNNLLGASKIFLLLSYSKERSGFLENSLNLSKLSKSLLLLRSLSALCRSSLKLKLNRTRERRKIKLKFRRNNLELKLLFFLMELTVLKSFRKLKWKRIVKIKNRFLLSENFLSTIQLFRL